MPSTVLAKKQGSHSDGNDDKSGSVDVLDQLDQ